MISELHNSLPSLNLTVAHRYGYLSCTQQAQRYFQKAVALEAANNWRAAVRHFRIGKRWHQRAMLVGP
jgi:hypothetical protein